MSGELTKLSETRWRYTTGRRVFYVKQLHAPNEDLEELGRFWVDAGSDEQYTAFATTLEHLLLDLRHRTHKAGR